MEKHGGSHQVQPRNGRRLILFPLPLQGHINPMLQLANILHSKGFSITIIHTDFNSPNPSSYPYFIFKSISFDSTSVIDVGNFLTDFNESIVEPFRDCLAGLLADPDEEPIVCLITDAIWYNTQAIADSLKLPRIVLRTGSFSSFLVYAALPLFLEKGYFHLPKQDMQSEEPEPDFPPLRIRDVTKITDKPEAMCKLIAGLVKGTKASSGVIWNTFKELEQPALETIYQDIPIPHFPIGPFHKYFPASSSSLLEQDHSFIPWLDLQAPKSVIYVSFGSVAQTDETEFREMAWGLANSMCPFLWVVRPGLIRGTEWLESLPNGFLEAVGERGHIVKWAPQQQVLAHPATGVFWTHNGWNSTLESICEGVPMICLPCFVDQPVNARYVSHVWEIGVQLENGFGRKEIERAIKRVMVDKEGQEVRERINFLRDKANVCLAKGGSSCLSLESLVNYILSF